MQVDFHQILQENWGYTDFRPLQHDIIESVTSGRDTLAILPTGGGKSLTYQVPALALPGLTIVISPLIALMTDQVNNLKTRGIRAEVLHAGLHRQKILYILEQAQYGAYNLLYLSPERLVSELFIKRLEFIDVSLIAVDEAHCISEWGYDFRPSYIRIVELRKFFPKVPVLALTASATPDVIDDIQDKLQLTDCNIFRGGVERDNLYYVVRIVRDKVEELFKVLKGVNSTSIVYARSRAKCEELAKILLSAGFSANYYHAGLDSEERTKRQNSWMDGETEILCATNAFGMGIDKSNVRVVVHYDIPDALEQYYQEAGRAGRDGNKAYAVLLATNGDLDRLGKRHEKVYPPKEYVRQVYQNLANYYVVGVGSGCNSVFPFSLEEFCHSCKMSYSMVSGALSILQWSGYITITEEMESSSKLKVVKAPPELFEWRMAHPENDRVLEFILRSCTGIFTDFHYINEDYIAHSLQINRDTVYNTLRLLHQLNVVFYIPYKRSPLLIYEMDREDADTLFIPSSAYENRIERLRVRLSHMYQYVSDTEMCRSKILAHYFGQKDALACGHCDVCLSARSL